MNEGTQTRIFEATLIKKKMLTHDIVGLTFENIYKDSFVPGQFYIIAPSEKELHNGREYSILSNIHQNSVLEFAVLKIAGGVISPFLHDLQIGKKVILKGPMGKYFNWNFDFDGTVVFIAGGVGIAPFMSMLRSKFDNKLVLLASFKSLDETPFLNELIAEEHKRKNFHMHITLTRTKKDNFDYGRIGRDFLQKHVPQEKNISYFICGGSLFVEDMYSHLLSFGISEKSIQRERFG